MELVNRLLKREPEPVTTIGLDFDEAGGERWDLLSTAVTLMSLSIPSLVHTGWRLSILMREKLQSHDD